MSSDAVLSYLRKEIKFGRLQIAGHKTHFEEELLSAAAELRDRTNGHPLHVIYATEELVRSRKPLSKWSIEQLSGDLSQDVKRYYGSLWQMLSASQRDVLRLICAFKFFWPKQAFSEIASVAGTAEPEVTAVEHLLHSSAAGLKAFHESLIVFVRQTDGFNERVAELTPHVETWLSDSAPNSLRVNWLWAVQARLGRPENLISGIQRDWILERLQEGYPIELFEGLLADAEELAFCRAQYADAYRLRHLKHRLLNSLSYQLIGADAARLKTCTWKLAPDDSVIDEAIASRHETSTVDVAALGNALAARGDLSNAETCGDEAYRRYLGESRFAGRHRGSEGRQEELYLVKSLSDLRVIGRTPHSAARIVGGSSPQIAGGFLEALVAAKDLRSLVDLALNVPDGAARALVGAGGPRHCATSCRFRLYPSPRGGSRGGRGRCGDGAAGHCPGRGGFCSGSRTADVNDTPSHRRDRTRPCASRATDCQRRPRLRRGRDGRVAGPSVRAGRGICCGRVWLRRLAIVGPAPHGLARTAGRTLHSLHPTHRLSGATCPSCDRAKRGRQHHCRFAGKNTAQCHQRAAAVGRLSLLDLPRGSQRSLPHLLVELPEFTCGVGR